jgi:hypothetical protein
MSPTSRIPKEKTKKLLEKSKKLSEEGKKS